MTEICCVCNEEAKHPYSYFHHVDEKTLHIYSGHKRCLSAIPTKLKNGKDLPYSKVDKTKWKK